MKKQVNKSHYEFTNYMSKERWLSLWHQLHEVLSLSPESVLEIGPGPGLFKLLSLQFGLKVETLDVDPELLPDYIARADNMPFINNQFDVVCAFQMLEHLPFNESLIVFNEMVRVSKRYIVISLPDVQKLWPYSFYIPKIGSISFKIKKPGFKPSDHEFDGQHYWELNKKGFSVEYVISEFIKNKKIKLKNNFRVDENPYHHFFIFKVE